MFTNNKLTTTTETTSFGSSVYYLWSYLSTKQYLQLMFILFQSLKFLNWNAAGDLGVLLFLLLL